MANDATAEQIPDPPQPEQPAPAEQPPAAPKKPRRTPKPKLAAPTKPKRTAKRKGKRKAKAAPKATADAGPAAEEVKFGRTSESDMRHLALAGIGSEYGFDSFDLTKLSRLVEDLGVPTDKLIEVSLKSKRAEHIDPLANL